ncbi:alpha/beta fold hydrolase [Niabella aquatica]
MLFKIYNLMQLGLLLTISSGAQNLTRAQAHLVDGNANGCIYKITQTNTGYRFDSATYTIFIPDSVKELSGVFIHQHGCVMEGRGEATAYDLQYQAFAKKWKLAVIAPDIYSSKNNCHDWKDPEYGSADALLKTLKEIGGLSGHPELANVPWLIWGHSGGGYWALSMLRQFPQRILALFGYSPAFAPGNYPSEALKVPVMMRHAGPVGDACCWYTSINEFGKLRSAGGYVSIAYTAGQTHNYSYVRYMAIPFFEAAMKQRFPEKSGSGFSKMKGIDTSKAWLGDTATYNIYPAAKYPGNKYAASWLPDSAVAIRWREYVINGTVKDKSPPAAPYDVSVGKRYNMSVLVEWKADADIESGISHFNIYKDDKLVTRFPAAGSYQTFDTNGDDAYPLETLPLQAEISWPPNDPGIIYISTVNHFGLESAKTMLQR